MPDIFKDERDQLERENWTSAFQGFGPGDEDEDDEEDEETGE